jgi:hypothetical protein
VKTGSDYLTAQLLERYQNESMDFSFSTGGVPVETQADSDYAAALKSQEEADSEAADLEHEWLKVE